MNASLSLSVDLSNLTILKPGFHIVFVGLCRLLWVAEGLTVLGKTVKDRERPNGNTTERSAKTLSDP